MAESKGYDDSPPRNGTILFYTTLTVFLLVGVKFMLDSYFAKMTDAEVEAKVLTQGMDEVRAMREQETKALQAGRMPIGNAIKMLAQRGRTAAPEIAPAPGAGKPEVAGWSQLKRQVAPAEAPAPAPAPADAPAADGAQPAAPDAAAQPAAPAAAAPAAPVPAAPKATAPTPAKPMASPVPTQPAAPDGKQ